MVCFIIGHCTGYEYVNVTHQLSERMKKRDRKRATNRDSTQKKRKKNKSNKLNGVFYFVCDEYLLFISFARSRKV